MTVLSTAEREAKERAIQLLPGAVSEGIAYGEAVWNHARDFYGPERVAERDVWTCMSCGHISGGQSCDSCGAEAMPGRWVAAEFAEAAEAKLATAVEALRDAEHFMRRVTRWDSSSGGKYARSEVAITIRQALSEAADV